MWRANAEFWSSWWSWWLAAYLPSGMTQHLAALRAELDEVMVAVGRALLPALARATGLPVSSSPAVARWAAELLVAEIAARRR